LLGIRGMVYHGTMGFRKKPTQQKGILLRFWIVPKRSYFVDDFNIFKPPPPAARGREAAPRCGEGGLAIVGGKCVFVVVIVVIVVIVIVAPTGQEIYWTDLAEILTIASYMANLGFLPCGDYFVHAFSRYTSKRHFSRVKNFPFSKCFKILWQIIIKLIRSKD